MEITKFLNEQYSDSALYMTYRNISSYIDGLKNSGRKVVYICKKQNIKSQIKVSALGSKIVEGAGYLHADTSIQGSIVTLAQNFCGANNLPILEPIGSFGTRHIPEAAAPRYIFTKPTDYFDELFRKEDDLNLNKQEFEGAEIEPVFYVPTLPMLLVNGSNGIGVGFSSNILARKLENVIRIVDNYLHNKKSEDDLFKPYWNGFDGEINYLGDNKWQIKGKVELNGKKLLIKEIPISWSLPKYKEKLNKSKEKCFIEKYTDLSENDKFIFEVKLTDKESQKPLEDIMKDLGLIEVITENLVCVDENNSIREFNSIKDIFNDYCKIKKEFFNKRIKSEINRLEYELSYLQNCFNFVTEVVEGKINILLKKTEVEKILKDRNYNFIDKLLSMPIYSLTSDKIIELNKKMENKYLELEAMKKETPVSLWKKDLKELEKKLNG